jgi:hypothetical protein
MADSCGSCLYCRDGRCHVMPPNMQIPDRWPTVHPDDWCGQFSKIKPVRKKAKTNKTKRKK